MTNPLLVNLFHIIFTGPFLVYTGLMKPNNKYIYLVLLLMAVILILVFVIQIAQGIIKPWIMLHACLFSILLGYMGYIGFFQGRQNIPEFSFSFLLALGLAATTYHLLRIVQKTLTFQQKS